MREVIRQRARELGFDDCRFTSAQPPQSAIHFEQWLAGGLHGEMGYLERNSGKRIDPQQVLPGAKTIIVLAISYDLSPTSEVQSPESPGVATRTGVIARYARFADYHAVIGEKLKLLTRFINQAGGDSTRSLWYVDTGPLLERDFAQRSGLGFVGKHTSLISRGLGNWIFLAEILTTLELEPDAPETNHCGTCERCISACPTQAIIAPFRLDARRCISYLTIELKGSIPVELRPLIGDRIYGCDDCLDVCPWNRFAQEATMMKPHARDVLKISNLVEILSLDEAQFKRYFAGMPMLRTKRRGLLRNVCVALGNVGDARALPSLEKAARDPEPLIAEHATWAIEQIRQRENPAAGLP